MSQLTQHSKPRKRPRSLIYANGEQPPVAAIAILGVQHAALSIVLLLYAVLIGKGAGLSVDEQQSLVTATLLACGIGALLQASRWRLGSALLVIPIAGPVFVPIAIQAGMSGGLGAIALLTLMVGLVQLPIGRFIHRVRGFFPPEVCGVVVLMLGVSLIPGALQRMLGDNSAVPSATVFAPDAALIGGITLAVTIAAAVWLKGTARFFAMVIGCLAGVLAAALTGYMDGAGELITTTTTTTTTTAATAATTMPVLAFPPLVWPGFELIPALLPVIVLLALIDSVDSMGVLISTDRLDDADWIRPDMTQISQGIQASGLTNLAAGLLGGTAISLSSSNIGLAFASGVTARIVAIAAGVILIAAAFFPKLIALVLAMPDPVLGGILAYVASYFIVAGADLALSRMLSQRRMLVIGLPITAGLSVLSLPELFRGFSGPLTFILESPLALSALCAIALNSLMRLGIAQTFATTLPLGQRNDDSLRELLNDLGEKWGLHRETAARANAALHELLDVVTGLASGPIEFQARTDDLHLDLRLIYEGSPLVFPDRPPSPEEMLEDPEAVARMSGWLLRHMAGRAVPFQQGNRQGVWLRFDS
jgi:xanthine permease XanP